MLRIFIACYMINSPQRLILDAIGHASLGC